MNTSRCTLGLVVFLLILVVALPALSAPLPPEVEKSLHDVEEIIINSEGDTSKVWDLNDNPQGTDIVYIDARSEKSDFSSSQWRILTDWIQNGGTLWLDTSSNSAFLKEFGLYPGETVKGTSARAGFHPTLTDVEEVNLYEGATLQDYDVPLLEKEGKVTAAINFYGNGMVMAVPVIVTDKHDGNRFKANLYEFGAGYQVPPSVTPDPEPASITEKVTLRSGEMMTGTLVTHSFQFRTPYGQFTFNDSDIALISLEQERDLLELTRGDRLIGTLLTNRIELRLPSGKVKTLKTEDMRRLVRTR
ncbi:MAG: hypothetical protein ACLFVS_07095 [Candidatus Acetothermia bacterium]